MQLSTLLLATIASLAAAQNPFTFTELPNVEVGKAVNITWAPSTGTVDTVTLVLRQGDPDHLATVLTIASGIENTGSYLWTPNSAIVKGDKYAFQITDDGNTDITNYSGQFSIDSPNTVSSALPSSTSGSSSSGSSSSSSMSMTSSASMTTSTGSSSSSSSGSESTSGSETSSSASRTSSESSSGTSTPAPNTSDSAAVGLKVSGGLLALVGAFMAAL